MNRRGFLGSILALGAAPAIVRAESIMRITPIVRLTDQTMVLCPGDYVSVYGDLTPRMMAAYAAEMLRQAHPLLAMERFSEERPLLVAKGSGVVTFRRYPPQFQGV